MWDSPISVEIWMLTLCKVQSLYSMESVAQKKKFETIVVSKRNVFVTLFTISIGTSECHRSCTGTQLLLLEPLSLVMLFIRLLNNDISM